MSSHFSEYTMASSNVDDETPEFQCYIHSVSPVKKSGQTAYFNYTLQTKDDTQRGVSFCIHKKETMDTLSIQKSPVKIKNYKYSYKYGKKDILVNKDTVFTPVSEAPSFSYVNQTEIMSIASLSNVAVDQLITIKGHLANLDATKKIIINDNDVKKQEAFINDPSGYIKLILWGGHADSLQQGKTYTFNNIRIREAYGQKYLNTPKQEDQCIILETDIFTEPLVEVENTSNVQDITAEVMGISNVSKNKTCISCGKKVTKKGKAASCTACKTTQHEKFCPTQWYFKLFIINTEQPSNKIKLNVFKQQVANKVLSLCDLTDDSSEEELEEAAIEIGLVSISYDGQSKQLISIEKIDI